MSLQMADGPVANLPSGFDAYAGYVNRSGIGITWPDVSNIPAKFHLSITTDGANAMCADVESGAMGDWRGYSVGYCSISSAQDLISRLGRPRKLWTAHYTDTPHICSPTCGFGFMDHADGTQWTTHGNIFDESLLLDNFFDFQQKGARDMKRIYRCQGQPTIAVIDGLAVKVPDSFDVTQLHADELTDVDAAFIQELLKHA